MKKLFNGKHEKPRDLASIELKQAIGGVALPDHSIDPEVLGLSPTEVRDGVMHKFSHTPNDSDAEINSANAFYERDLARWREQEDLTCEQLTDIIDTFTGQRLDPPKEIDDYEWAKIYDAELSLIKQTHPNPKPTNPNTEA